MFYLKSSKILLLLFCLLCIIGSACKQSGPVQTIKTDSLKTAACGFISLNGFYFPRKLGNPDSAVQTRVSEILEATGMHLNNSNKNFFLAESDNLKNALAIAKPRVDVNKYLFVQRYIVYDRAYLDHLDSVLSAVASYVIFCHELTHHLNGDSFMDNDSPQQKRQRELAADSFAGFLCYKLSLFHHFTLADCLKVYEMMGDSADTPTHPNKLLREQTFQDGWTNSVQYLSLSCQAAGYLQANPVPAINELAAAYPQKLTAVKTTFSKLLSLRLPGFSRGTQVISLRGDTAAFVKRGLDRLAPLHFSGKATAPDMKIISARQVKAGDTSDYIVDSRHVIWAKYPNGVPYIAGYTQKLN